MESPFASWMERLRFEDPSRAIPDEKSKDAELIAKTSDKHEDRFLQSLRDQGRDIASVPKDDFEMELGLIRQAITGQRPNRTLPGSSRNCERALNLTF